MATAIVLDEKIHVKSPEGGHETVCGLEYTDSDVEYKAHSGIHYIDHVLANLRTKAEFEEECETCINFENK